MAKVPGKTLWPSGTLELREPRLASSGNVMRAARVADAPPAIKIPKVKPAKLIKLSSMAKIQRAPRL